MCGIFGSVGVSGKGLLDEEAIMNCLETMRHRGPDARGCREIHGDSSAGYLAHVRLAIIDLQGGSQPLADESQRYTLTFNGEIYNYRELRDELKELGHSFRDNSDTEVLLRAYQQWDRACLDKIRGMFAFAVWDVEEEALFLARDHFGKKPVFYSTREHDLVFASEIKSLLELPDRKFRLNCEQLANYCVYRYVPAPATFVAEIEKLPPGSYMVWSKGRVEIKRYYLPPDCKNSAAKAVDSPVREFWGLLHASVKSRMVSDVPYGAFLSGGIDSSAIVALMAHESDKPVKTFSIGFEESEYSELVYAKTIADYFDTDHTEIVVSQDDLMEKLPEVVMYRDAPVSEPSDIPILMLSREASRSVKMVLTGEGSDEVLGGYPKHSFERFVGLFQLFPALIRKGLFERLVDQLPYKYRRAKTAIKNMNETDFLRRMPGWFGALDFCEAKQMVGMSVDDVIPGYPIESTSPVKRILSFDQLSWLPDNLLERGDRMTMAASIEARMPFMDIDLARFMSSLPDNYRIRGRVTKWILREAMKNVLPQEILSRPKVGFRVPVNVWFQTTMKDYLLEHLLGENSITSRLLDTAMVSRYAYEHIDGEHNHEKLLWMLLNLEIWLRQNSTKIEIG